MPVANTPPALTVAWAADAEPARAWLEHLRTRAPHHTFLEPDTAIPASAVDVVLVAGPLSRPLDRFDRFDRLKLVQSLWAGVDGVARSIPAGVPLARLVDHQMKAAMTQAAVAHVMSAHLHHDEFRRSQRERRWQPQAWRPAARRAVGVLGLGTLGEAVATTLRDLGFSVRGWSAHPKSLTGIESFWGDAQLKSFLEGCEIAVCLLPLTDKTRDLLDADAIRSLPRGAVLINLARGELVVEADLLAAFEDGHLRHAVLDVFRSEPLPASSPLWSHPCITVTPHVAAPTQIDSGAELVAENLDRLASGLPPHHLVDLKRNY